MSAYAPVEGGREPILSLTTIAINRPMFAVNGVPYDLAMPDDLGIARRERYQRLWARVGQLIAARDASDGEFTFAQEDEWDTLFAKMAEIVVFSAPAELCDVMPRAVFDTLTKGQKYTIVTAFFQAALGPIARSMGTTLAPVMPIKAKRPRAAKSTGAKRSRASNASTAETPADG